MKTKEHLYSSLPAVLKDYLPEYEPKSTINVKTSTSRGKTSIQRNVSIDSQTSVPRAYSAALPERSDSTEFYHKRKQENDAERYEQLSLKWDLAKSEVKQDQYQLLKEKVCLQQQLIKQQDALAQARRDEVTRQQKQQRESEKARKQAKELTLVQKCKDSLEEDRKSASKERKSKAKSPASSTSTSTPSSPVKTPSERSRRIGQYQPNLPPVARTPSNSDLIDRESSWSIPDSDKLQWHQQQLYQVLGKGADYFLHPKIEKKAVKPINSKLRREGGRAGVERLLKTLRDESQIRLLNADAHIPQELKDTFGAFVRESIGKDRQPVQRFFCAEDDVPELERLQDHSKSIKVAHYKHKTDLMYRASRNNEDRTNILFHNNPLPEVAVLDKEQDGVGKYLPSWMDELAESEPEFMKWVREGKETSRDLTSQPIREDEEAEEKLNKSEEFTDEMILQMTRKRHRSIQPKYVFLKEKDTKVKGTFTDKFKDQYDNPDLPRPFDGSKLPPPPKAKSVLGLTTGSSQEVERLSCQSAPVPDEHRPRYLDYTTNWEPLSMTALIEYSQRKEVEGEGEFNQGRPKMWPTEVKVS